MFLYIALNQINPSYTGMSNGSWATGDGRAAESAPPSFKDIEGTGKKINKPSFCE